MTNEQITTVEDLARIVYEAVKTFAWERPWDELERKERYPWIDRAKAVLAAGYRPDRPTEPTAGEFDQAALREAFYRVLLDSENDGDRRGMPQEVLDRIASEADACLEVARSIIVWRPEHQCGAVVVTVDPDRPVGPDVEERRPGKGTPLTKDGRSVIVEYPSPPPLESSGSSAGWQPGTVGVTTEQVSLAQIEAASRALASVASGGVVEPDAPDLAWQDWTTEACAVIAALGLPVKDGA